MLLAVDLIEFIYCTLLSIHSSHDMPITNKIIALVSVHQLYGSFYPGLPVKTYFNSLMVITSLKPLMTKSSQNLLMQMKSLILMQQIRVGVNLRWVPN